MKASDVEVGMRVGIGRGGRSGNDVIDAYGVIAKIEIEKVQSRSYPYSKTRNQTMAQVHVHSVDESGEWIPKARTEWNPEWSHNKDVPRFIEYPDEPQLKTVHIKLL